jgi:hypothetical protein
MIIVNQKVATRFVQALGYESDVAGIFDHSFHY